MTTRVMLLDPIPDHLGILTNCFLHKGCNTIAFMSGEEGMRVFEQFQPHLLVSELFLKDWHRAWQIGQWICKGDAKLRPYMMGLTCQIKDEREARKQIALCMENGFDEVAMKPISPDKLDLRIEKARRLALLNGSYV